MDTYYISCEVKTWSFKYLGEFKISKDWTISNILLNYMHWFFKHFHKILKKLLLAPSFPSVRLGTHGTTRLPLDRFSWNLVFEDLSKICRRDLIFSKMTKMAGNLHEYLRTYIYETSRWVLLRARNFADKSCRECQNTHFMFSKLFPPKFYRLWDNVENYDRCRQTTNENIIWRMRFVRWIHKATNTHLEHALLNVSPPQQRLEEGASKLWGSISSTTYEAYQIIVATVKRVHNVKKTDESRTRRDEQRRKYSKMDKGAKDDLFKSPRENGGG